MVANWSNIPTDIGIRIIELAELHEDFETFRFISSQWRLAAKQAKFRGRVTVPWILLREDENSLTRCPRLYSFHSQKVRHIDLPSSSSSNGRFFGRSLLSSRGWLLSANQNRSENISLLEPLTATVIKFSMVWQYHQLELLARQATTLPYNYGTTVFQKFTLSANPSTTSNFMIAMIVAEIYPCLRPRVTHNLIVFLSSDNTVKQWVPSSGRVTYGNCTIKKKYNDVCFYSGQFYAVDDCGLVWQFDLGHEIPSPSLVYNLLSERHSVPFHQQAFFYLIELDGQLHLVTRLRVSTFASSEDTDHYTNAIQVFELNLDDHTVTKVHDLGTRAIFIGANSTFSVEATSISTYGCKPNCIYYTDELHDSGRGDDIGVYNVASVEIEPFYDDAHVWVESPTVLPTRSNPCPSSLCPI